MIEIPTGPNVDWSGAMAAIRAERLRKQTGVKLSAPGPVMTKDAWPPDYDQVYLWRQTQLARFEQKPELIEAAKLYYKTHNVEFICHWMDTYDPRNAGGDNPVWMPFILFGKQVDLLRFTDECVQDQERGLVEKSRTMGATWVEIGWSVHRWLFWPGTAIGWGSQKAESVDRIGDPKSIFEKLRQAIRRLPPIFLPRGFTDEHLKQYVCTNPENGSSIVGEVGNSIGRGGRTLIYFCDESAHYQHPEMIEASLSENTRVPMDISSVSGPNTLFHRKREAGVDWAPDKKIEKGFTRVLVMDWSDHPAYDNTWYRTKKAAAVRQGTPHIFAQEIERDYSAALSGVIIPSEHVEAAVDAHIKLGIPEEGGFGAALDIADGGIDTNALSGRQGIVLNYLDEWAFARDPGVSARKAAAWCGSLRGKVDLQYDCVGIGVAVKTEINNLKDRDAWPKNTSAVPWHAGETCLNPFERSDPKDPDSPQNRDLYENLKAQAWSEVARKFYLTWCAIEQLEGRLLDNPDFTWQPEDLISLSSKLALLGKLKKELSQAVMVKSARLKMMVDKTPEGSKSPNLGDAVIMNYWPIQRRPLRRGSFVAPMQITPRR